MEIQIKLTKYNDYYLINQCYKNKQYNRNLKVVIILLNIHKLKLHLRMNLSNKMSHNIQKYLKQDYLKIYIV